MVVAPRVVAEDDRPVEAADGLVEQRGDLLDQQPGPAGQLCAPAVDDPPGRHRVADAPGLLASGDNAAAKEMLAGALCVYPRSRPLRSLYYVSSALTALDAGQLMLATSQLEAALAHDEQCVEAAAILDQLRRDGRAEHDAVRRLFE